MSDRYEHRYVNCEVSEIIDTVENESLSAERLTDLLNTLTKKCELQTKIIQKQELSLCELSNNLTAIRKWGVKAPCFNEKGEYVEENDV